MVKGSDKFKQKNCFYETENPSGCNIRDATYVTVLVGQSYFGHIQCLCSSEKRE